MDSRLAPCAAFLLAALAAPLAATDYFVSPAGDDFNSGTPGSPFRTMTRAFQVASFGDTVQVASGDYDASAGESFPLALPDGVFVIGDPNVPPLVDAQTSGDPAFLVVGVSSGLLQSLQIVGSAGTTALAIGAPTSGLELTACSFFCTNGSSLASADGSSLLGGGPVTFAASECFFSASDGVAWEPPSGASDSLSFTSCGFHPLGTGGDGLRVRAVGASNVDLNIQSCNFIADAQGLDLQADARDGLGNSLITGSIDSCLVEGADSGLRFFSAASTGASALVSPSLTRNRVENGGAGLVLQFELDSGVEVGSEASLRENEIRAFGGAAIELALSGPKSADLRLPDLGMTMDDFGLNTFDSTGPLVLNQALAVPTRGGGLPLEWAAYGNWWGTDVGEGESGIKARMTEIIFVNVGGFLFDTLGFDLVGGINQNVVTIEARAGSRFVERIYTDEISILLGGVVHPLAAISETGNRARFTRPLNSPSGTVAIVVTNPGGQAGGLTVRGARPVDPINPFGVVPQGGENCFVATASYGDAGAPEVRLLRKFRDESLATNAFGRALVRAYYAASPPLAAAISDSEAARAASRIVLAPAVGAVRLWLEQRALLLLAVALLGYWRLRKRN